MTNFERVAAMNTAFGNPEGSPNAIDWARIRKQSLNIPDEFGELMVAMGADPALVKAAVAQLKVASAPRPGFDDASIVLDDVRDALCDIHVFAYGDHHLMGINADVDMNSVVSGVMTRFIKDKVDQAATIKLHADAGVTHVYFEGEYPTMVMKSASDQPDAPKGKFLKSASYSQPVFEQVVVDCDREVPAFGG